MYEQIKKILISKKNDIDETTLKFLANYFTVVVTRNVIPDGMNIDELMDNVLRMGKIIFFKDDDPITEIYGNNFKGKRDTKNQTLYVRDSLPADLKEMVIYHEIHHAAQTSEEMSKKNDGGCGIKQESNIGRMIMEAQTQWFAEEVYKAIHGINFEEREIPSENLRMQNNQTIKSSLHNYEMYGTLLKKLSIIMNVPEEYFVKINYMYNNNLGLKQLQADYEKIREKKGLSLSFKGVMQIFDYAYVVDNICYVKQLNHDLVLSGGETPELYEIHPNLGLNLSQKLQAAYLAEFDRRIILDLMKSANHLEPDSDFIRFSNYIFDNKNRNIIDDYIKSKTNEKLASDVIKK